LRRKRALAASLGLAALGAATSVIPTCHGAEGHLRAMSAVLGIGLIADLM
jgi:hypothetical protein